MKALIIDDEPMPAKHLHGMIREYCFEITSIHIINSPIDAIRHLKDHHYDLVFLDVEMPEINGFELLKEAQVPASTQVIFTTAYSQYAIEAFQANAAHYIVKVVTEDELVKAVRKAYRLHRNTESAESAIASNGVITVFHGDEHHIIKAGDIIRLEAERSYTSIVLVNRKFLSSKGIGYYEKLLSSGVFFRCHNSHLINLEKVTRLGKGRSGYIVLSNEDVVPLATSKRGEFEKRLKL